MLQLMYKLQELYKYYYFFNIVIFFVYINNNKNLKNIKISIQLPSS